MRTGILTEHRLCPRHGNALEACVTQDKNPAWWCDACGGTWGEEYFAMRIEASLPVAALECRFRVACPRCGSPRARRACNIECCDLHACTDCEQYFFIDHVVTRKSQLPKRTIRALKERPWLEGGAFGSRAPVAQPPRGTPRDVVWETVQTTGACRWCAMGGDRWGLEDDTPTVCVLCVNGWPADERFRFGWVCLQCGGSTPVYTGKPHFTPETRPQYHCRVCHHVTFDQGEDWRRATCVTCGTEFRLRVKLHTPPWLAEAGDAGASAAE